MDLEEKVALVTRKSRGIGALRTGLIGLTHVPYGVTAQTVSVDGVVYPH